MMQGAAGHCRSNSIQHVNLDDQRLGDETAVFWAVVASEIFRYSETFAKELDQTFCSSSGSKERVVAPGSTEGIQQMAAPTEEVMQFVLVSMSPTRPI